MSFLSGMGKNQTENGNQNTNKSPNDSIPGDSISYMSATTTASLEVLLKRPPLQLQIKKEAKMAMYNKLVGFIKVEIGRVHRELVD